VSVIDCAADTVVATILVGNYPYRLVHNLQHDKIYVATSSGNNVVVLDGAGDSVITSVNAGQSPYTIAYSERTGLAYVGISSREVLLIDGATNAIRKTVPSGSRCEVFAVNPAGGRVYAISSYSSSISVIADTLTGVEESPKPQASNRRLGPTIVRGVLFLLEARGEKREARSELLDIGGRKVLNLKPGANDVRSLAPGVYFVRQAEPGANIGKVVLTR
jgi:YVTN family beta-propeller protein